jgi:aminoglycoside phosphotransferase family enzyme/predicted kinase
MGTLVSDLAQDHSLIETHISWVFLAEHDVYKLKKPVNFGFLDFTTIELRRAACVQEVALNARLTHDVYLGVKPVTRDQTGAHHIDGEGTVVDYCVHMRRLSEADRLDCLLEGGALDSELVSRLALHLAGFHRAAATNEKIAAFGQAAAIRSNVVENFAQTRDHLQEFITAEQARQLEQSQLDFLERHKSLFAQRVYNGRIRDGHGDLRLEHVYQAGNQFQILDCIEFNERFRYADVCADLAFLTMDLRHSNRTDLAEVLLARYAEETCDFELYAVLDFYESYRAMVRAKVNLFTATNLQTPDAQRRQAHREAERYLAQALRSATPPATGAVIAVGGMIAAGKSHTCNTLSQLLECPVIATDRVRKQRMNLDPYTPLHEAGFSGAYSETATQETYEAVRQSAAHVVRSGRPVVIDASFRSRRERSQLVDWCHQLGADMSFVECVAPTETLRARLRERASAPSVSDGREAIFDEFARTYQTPDELPAARRCTLDTTVSAAEQTRLLRTFIRSLS